MVSSLPSAILHERCSKGLFGRELPLLNGGAIVKAAPKRPYLSGNSEAFMKPDGHTKFPTTAGASELQG